MKPIKVLLASANYPNEYYMWGPWNKEANVALSQNESLDVETVAPLPYSLPFKQFPYYNLSKIPKIEYGPEGIIHRPHFLYLLPKKLFYGLEGSLYQYSMEKYSKNFQKPDLVHCHHIYPDGYGFMNLCKKWDVPLIVDIHRSNLFTEFLQEKKLSNKILKVLNYASKIICISQEIKNIAVDYGLNEDKLNVIPLGIDISNFKPRDKEYVRSKLSIEQKNVILYVGQLIKRKGVKYLIQSISSLHEELKNDLKVFIIGDGPEKDYLVSLTKELKLEKIIEFKRMVNRDEIPYYYSAADLFVLPSFSEGKPVVIYEAMACGVAILATDVGGVSEQIQNGISGILVDSGTKINSEISFLLDNKDIMKKLGIESRKWVLKNEFTLNNYQKKIINEYNKVIN